jgi:hypothetical protein
VSLRYFLALALLGGAFAGPADAIGNSSGPIRHLTYAFTYSGVADGAAAVDDRGTIVVDVIAIQPDNGLLVRVSEQSQRVRDAASVKCLVYGNTDVVCEANAKINAEELTVIRLLGRNFADPSKFDANGHRRESRSSPVVSVASDYAIDASGNGILHVSTQRVTTQYGPQGFTASAVGKIIYDVYRTLPTSVTEDETTRSQEANGHYSTTRVQTSVTLTSDSMAGP